MLGTTRIKKERKKERTRAKTLETARCNYEGKRSIKKKTWLRARSMRKCHATMDDGPGFDRASRSCIAPNRTAHITGVDVSAAIGNMLATQDTQGGIDEYDSGHWQ